MNRPLKKGKPHTFDCYTKRVLKNEACDYFTTLKKQNEREIPFSSLSYEDLGKLSTVDTYFEAEHIFPCFGCLVIVNDDDLAGAISSLTDSQQAIILAYYFLDFSDRQIGEKLGMLRATVQYNRKLALRKMKLYLEED